MEHVVEIDFTAALGELQALLRRQVRVCINAHGTLCGSVITGVLERIETLPPDNQAVELVIGKQCVVLDPADVSSLLVGEPAAGIGAVEFALTTTVTIRVERAIERGA